MFRRFLLIIAIVSLGSKVSAQETWSSPEVEQMYRQAKDYLSKGAVAQAMQLLKQTIQLEPGVMVLYRDLAQAQNISGQYKEAYETVSPVISQGRADEQTYQVAAVALLGAKNAKKARAVLEEGIKVYPHSGVLYYELGKYFDENKDPGNALATWLGGIENDPSYHLNYYEAARKYATTDRPLWTILYGEQFVNIERYTGRSTEMKKMIMDAYKQFFAIASGFDPATVRRLEEGKSFEDAVTHTYLRLSPVVSDGITAENLIMLRTRFVINWLDNYDEKYPYSLFTYHDRLLQQGLFEAYNQWLFGKAEHEEQYASWTKFHPKAIPAYENWAAANKLQAVAADFYNDKEVKRLFSGKKK